MEPPRKKNDRLTPSQQRATAARGNVLVMAGAGTGKTHTLVERCLDCLVRERASLDEILVVTFTEAAATEMRQRLRAALEKTLGSQPSTLNQFCAEQLALFDAAHIGTLHGFCLKLVRGHFYELGLDPQAAVLGEGEARLLAGETLDEALQDCYAGQDEFSIAVQNLVRIYGGGRDENIRELVLRLHDYSQTRPDAEGWLAAQVKKFSTAEPADWQKWLLIAVADWRDEWTPVLESVSTNEKAAELTGILRRLPRDFSRKAVTEVLGQIISADGNWPAKQKGVLREPLKDLFGEAEFLLTLTAVKNGGDPLAEDWNWVREHMAALLRLAREFERRFSERKRADGALDFHDLEQFTLKLLWNFGTGAPTETARRWREKLRFVFVDEYQDINAAQDKIIQALSRENLECGDESPLSTPRHVAAFQSADVSAHSKGNRFLVGDVKQSIYRFRLADPKIFRDYAQNWRGKDGQTIPLSENFRSREPLLNFVNSVFGLLMRGEIGGVDYDAEAKLEFGSPETRADFSAAKDPSPRTELLLRFKNGRAGNPSDGEGGGSDGLADLEESEKEARLLALRLKELEASGHEIWDDEEKIFRAAKWSDMAVLLRSPSGKSEIFAKQFERAGVPLAVARGGFFDSAETLDLLGLLQLLDNPLQDVPAIAVLRSPIAGCSLDELAEIRLAAKRVHFWTALNRWREGKSGKRKAESGNADSFGKINLFLNRFSRWRQLARQASLSRCIEEILAETHYADWLPSQPRGAQRRANVEQFLNLAQQFDRFQRRGLFRFLKFIQAQREAGVEPEVAAAPEENAVRLMSIHQCKGLEFPVVALADLAKQFNMRDLRGEIILDGEFGLCPRVKPPGRGGRYPGLTHWLAQRRQRRELLGEELRLLYVAMTRARDTLLLIGSVTEKKWRESWNEPAPVTARKIVGAKSLADWLGLWFANQVQSPKSAAHSAAGGELPHLRWRIADDAELAERSESGKQKAEMELPALDKATAEKLRAALSWNYPFAAATRRAAKSSVTALRREAEALDDEAEKLFPGNWPATIQRRKAEGGRRELSAAEIGAACHRFLQHVAPGKTGGVAALKSEAERLESEKILSAAERASLDLEALADFWNSAIGKQIRVQPEFVRRELPFTAKFSPAELTEILGTKPEAGLDGEFAVVQGVADLAVLLPREIWLVDFKTDAVRPDELPAKTKIYKPQLKLYAAALGRIYSRPVTHCWLHFLSARRTVMI